MSGLNDEQMQAVKHVQGPLLIIAGAGSGKTRVVTTRIVHLLQSGVHPKRILGVTFTNKAAQEMKERVAHLTQSPVLICTFHSLGVRILRESISALGYRHDFVIYDAEDSAKIIKSCLADFDVNNKKQDVKAFQNLISQAKNALQEPSDEFMADLSPTTKALFPKIYQCYQAKLREAQALDFDDLIYLPVKLFREHPETLEKYQRRWDFLLIDEYQDTNAAQYTLVNLLVEKHLNLCVVGDPDQSIYAWRGADIKNILHFEKDYPSARLIRLEQNYRSTVTILEAANAVIQNNFQRYEKKLWSNRGAGEKIKTYQAYDEIDEAEFVASTVLKQKAKGLSYNDIAVLYRTHFQSRALEDEFLSKRIPYVIIGGISFYQRREIKDILSFLRVVQSGTDFIAFARTVNLPKRGLGDATIEKLRAGAAQKQMDLYEFCKKVVNKEVTDTKLSAKPAAGLKNYIDLIDSLRLLVTQKASLKDIMLACIENSGYFQVLAEDKDTLVERKENLDSLVAKAAEWEEERQEANLAEFLEELTLKSSLDESAGSTECVQLMTVHNGKGLEFPIVFLVGLEEGLFPHNNSKGSPSGIEEERRLYYVGMTRAKDLLYLTYCSERRLAGMFQDQMRSRFLIEVPAIYKETVKKLPKSFP